MSDSITLIDVDEGIYLQNAVVDADTIDKASLGDQWSVRLQRLSGGPSDGVDVIRLDNGLTTLAVLPTRGMGIWKGEIAGIPLGWNSPVERPVHPARIDEMRRGGIGWLDGFNEVVCRCGLGWHGAPGNDVVTDDSGNVIAEQFLPLHGRIANLSAHKVVLTVSDDGELSITGTVDEAGMFGGRLRLTSTLSTRIGSNAFEISDTVHNLGSAAAEVEMLYHCNFGQPFLGDGSTLHTAATKVAPRDARAAQDVDTWDRCTGPEAGYAEQVYFTQPVSDENHRGVALLRGPTGQEAVEIRFDTRTLPWLVFWKNTQAEEDGYCAGLEPGSSLPNLKTFERQQGRVISLSAGDDVTFDLAVTVAVHADDVARMVENAEALQRPHERTVQDAPDPNWSA